MYFFVFDEMCFGCVFFGLLKCFDYCFVIGFDDLFIVVNEGED